MSKNPQFPNILLTKRDICNHLGYKSMEIIYKKILSEKIITKELGFNSISEFKKVKQFNLEQSRELKRFLLDLKNETKP